MNKLLYKELKLSLNPGIYIFPALSALLLVPSYPYFVAFIYTFVGFITLFIANRESKDVFFTASLPIRKRDTVKARVLTITLIELVQIVVAVPFAIISAKINPQGNIVGIEANAAFFGLVFGMYALYNAIFFPMFYKTAYKVARPLIISCTAVTLYIFAAELTVQSVGALKAALDTRDPAYMGLQLLVLAAGVICFVLVTVLAYKAAAKRFEKVDL